MIEKNSATFPLIAPLFKQKFELWRLQQKPDAVFFTGIYMVKTSVPIQRKTGCDEEGILYIGRGVILGEQHRLFHLADSFNAVDIKHMAGVMYNGKRYIDLYPLKTLSLYIEIAGNYRTLAVDIIETYRHKYGELPLLN